MIPKIIHYCWFGHNKLPTLAVQCIQSWKKFLPDYEIKEWNENNFDVNNVTYTREAYRVKRYAFVSDYVRFYVLYHYGGLYFDTDVKIIKPIDDIINRGSFMGRETIADANVPLCVNPGLGLGLEPEHLIVKKLLGIYNQQHFINADGTHNLKTIVQYTTDILIDYGLNKDNKVQCIEGIWIYPNDYFDPCNRFLKKIIITDNTRTIHYFAASWVTKKERLNRFLAKVLGPFVVKVVYHLKNMIHNHC